MLKPRTVLNACGLLMIIHAIMWIPISGQNVDTLAPNISDEASILLDKTDELVAFFNLLFAVMIIGSSFLGTNAARFMTKIVSICMGFFAAFALYHIIGYPEGYGPPIVLPIIFGLLQIWSGYVGFRVRD